MWGVDVGMGKPLTQFLSLTHPLARLLHQEWPQIHGFIPENKLHSSLVSIGVALFIGGTLVSKWTSIASLASVSSVAAGIWLASECAVLLILRHAMEGTLCV